MKARQRTKALTLKKKGNNRVFGLRSGVCRDELRRLLPVHPGGVQGYDRSMEQDAGGGGAELMGADATAGDHHHPATCAEPVDGG